LLARWFSLDVRHGYDAGALIESMRRDKKAAGSSVTLILPKALGEMELVKTQIDGLHGSVNASVQRKSPALGRGLFRRQRRFSA